MIPEILISLDRQRAVRLHLLHHRVGPRLAHARQREQALSEEAAVSSHVGDPRLDEVIEPARDHVAFEHFRRTAHGGGELLEDVRRGLVEGDLDEHQKPEPEAMRIEPGAEARDHPLLLQAPHPLARGGGRKADALGELDVGETPVALEFAQDAPVCAVDIGHIL